MDWRVFLRADLRSAAGELVVHLPVALHHRLLPVWAGSDQSPTQNRQQKTKKKPKNGGVWTHMT